MDSTAFRGKRQRAAKPGCQGSLKNRRKQQCSRQADNNAKTGDSSDVGTIFQREDWTLSRNLNTLGQKAGVAQEAIAKLVAKELTDNALDNTAACQYGATEDGWLYVEDTGEGLPGSDAEIAALFSVSRPLASSKLLRLPTRGALGNGLRVVAGAVLASDGKLIVKTRGRALRLRPRDSDGGTDVEHLGAWNGTGTRVEVLLGDSLPIDEETFEWANRAMRLTGGESYKGKPSPSCYDADSFYELMQAAGATYHPHTGEQIPLGTRSVEAYKRPEWTFNKILYCEKEGFFPILIDAQWPERHDCALLTSKGFSTRATRDVLDLLGDGDEPLTFFCIHDADGPGTVIYQSLQEGTKARPGRRVEIINLGLDPAEALEMGLPVEPVEMKARAVPVADYIEPEWREWLQEHRVELNAMDTPTFLAWLDAKMEPYGGKLIPPQTVLAERLVADVRRLIRQTLVAEAIRAARVDEQTEATITRLQPQIERAEMRLLPTVERELTTKLVRHWSAPVSDVAEKLAAIGRRRRKE